MHFFFFSSVLMKSAARLVIAHAIHTSHVFVYAREWSRRARLIRAVTWSGRARLSWMVFVALVQQCHGSSCLTAAARLITGPVLVIYAGFDKAVASVVSVSYGRSSGLLVFWQRIVG